MLDRAGIAGVCATAVVFAFALGGCSIAGDKAGGDGVVLELGVIDSVNAGGRNVGQQAFVDELAEVSGGRIQVEILDVWGDGAPDAESRLVEAIATGEVDGGFASVRAFPAAGHEPFGAVEAPFTLTSYAAMKEFVSSAAADRLLDSLEGSGIVGVGMTVGSLRRPFGVDRPILDLADWEGEVRVFNSAVQAQTMEALGAEPVSLSFAWIDQARAGALRGIEFDVFGYLDTGATTEAGNLTSNAVLWPKINVLAISQRTWDGLTQDQRGWIVQAGNRAVAASVAADYDETLAVEQLCDAGVRLFELSDAQLDAWREAAAPVIEALESSPRTKDVLRDVQTVASRHPADVLDVPEGCEGTAAVSSALPSEPPDSVAPVPDGVYRVDVTSADVEANDLSNGPGWTGTWTMTIDDGTYAVTCRPIDANGKDCGNQPIGAEGLPEGTVLEAGHLLGDDTHVFLVYDGPMHSDASGCELPCHPLPTRIYTWRVNGEELVLGAVEGGHSEASFTLSPWLRLP